MDASATDRMLLQSSKPSLHTNVHCSALAAAVVSRQVSIVRLLLQVTCTSISVSLSLKQCWCAIKYDPESHKLGVVEK